ncbi:MAG: hypothetical protein HYV37_02185 [Candidatus Levyibacteriota bacterium]|nr:MAG: hypothetical protein HYV37_02185 [Candidatus Levybacteria bacterium]
MNKSFGYDNTNHTFRLARNEIGDFGLHLSLIRSFSWGNNFPPESPFFPGRPLPYHYYFDFIVGLLERSGIPINYAFNGLSAMFFTLLLFLLYKLPQRIFFKSKMLGVISVLLFVFHSGFTFVDFLKQYGFSFYSFWHLPDYIDKGPFDGSLISIFFTLNVYLNQRHLVAGLVLSFGIFYFLLPYFLDKNKPSFKKILLCGFILGILSGIHTLIFFITILMLFLMMLLFRKFYFLIPLFFPAFALFSIHVKDIINQNLQHLYFNPGFLSEKPITLQSFFIFWFVNTGIAFFIIPLSVFFSNKKQKILFVAFLPLFIIGNIFQLSFRIEHNHSIFNYFFIFGNFYIAFFLVRFFSNGVKRKIVLLIFLFFLTASGVIDLMAVKNDFQLSLPDAPANKFMLWIKNDTKKDSIFLSKQEILDPITFSGRKNYLGHTYYLSVMGYNFQERQKQAASYFEANSTDKLISMRKAGINYIVIPKGHVVDFNYNINQSFFDKNLQKVYQDKSVSVYKL